jgi:hypothetical protein
LLGFISGNIVCNLDRLIISDVAMNPDAAEFGCSGSCHVGLVMGCG